MLERHGYLVIAEAGDGREACRLAAERAPRVALVDLSLPLLNGVEVGRHLREALPETAAVALAADEEESQLLAALDAGFRGVVLKSQGSEDLLRTLERVRRGLVALGPTAGGILLEAYRQRRSPARDPLTCREREVLQLLAEGKTTKDMAEILGTSPKTAESHRHRIRRKLGIPDTAGLVRYAIRRGLVEP